MSERLATVELAGLSGAVSLGRRIYECYSGIDPAGCLRKRNSLILLCVNGGGKTGQDGGAVGHTGLLVLHTLIFDFLNFSTGRLDPSYAAIARKGEHANLWGLFHLG
jgi:hypothetical protein